MRILPSLSIPLFYCTKSLLLLLLLLLFLMTWQKPEQTVDIIVKAQPESECLSPSILACENTAMAFSWNEKEKGKSVASYPSLVIHD